MYGVGMAAEAAQSFAYEIKKDSAVILRCFSHDTRAVIPEWVEGYPVTEIAPYAFSAHLDEQELQAGMADGRVRVFVPEALGDAKLPPLCGNALEEVLLPYSVRRVGRYCFYDCRNLRSLTFSGNLADWGSGVFTRCHQVREVCVYTDHKGNSYLKEVLDELPEEVFVEYYSPAEHVQDSAAGQDTQPGAAGKNSAAGQDTQPGVAGKNSAAGQDTQPGAAGKHNAAGQDTEPGSIRRCGSAYVRAQLLFPEFYEEGVENTPARILETHVHGSGMSYRNCFRGRAFDFGQYDVLFPRAVALERPEIVFRIASGRLRCPVGLSAKAEQQYEAYLWEHLRDVGIWLLKQRDLEGTGWMLERFCRADRMQDAPETWKWIGEWTQYAAEQHFTEAVSLLMNCRGTQPRGKRRKRLEL